MGVKGRLYIAFGSVVIATLASTLVGWLSLKQSAETLTNITTENVPAVVRQLRMSRDINEITATAPKLVAAETKDDAKQVWKDLIANKEQLSKNLENVSASPEDIKSLTELFKKFLSSLSSLQKLVDKSLGFDEALEKEKIILRSKHKEALAVIAPKIDDINFDIIINAEDIDPLQPNAISNFIDDNINKLIMAFEVKSEINLAFGLLSQTITTGSPEKIRPLRERFNASRGLLETAMSGLKSTTNIDEIEKIIIQIIKTGTEANNIFDNRYDQLINFQEISKLIGKIENLSVNFQSLIEEVVNKTEQSMVQATIDSEKMMALNINLLLLFAIGSVVMAIIISVVYVDRGLARRLMQLCQAMVELSKGKMDITIDTSKKDEIGQMASALKVFKQAVIEKQEMEVLRVENSKKHEQEKIEAMIKLSNLFESKVGDIVSKVNTSSESLYDNMETMSTSLQDTLKVSDDVSGSAGNAERGVEEVSFASEELAESIKEISNQVLSASENTKIAVQQTEATDTAVANLSAAATRIGNVIELIQDIAEQTNLLALNATIEAARAGEFGKGFAVVANEVKVLASQTAKATDEITKEVHDIQSLSNNVVSAIQLIGEQINHVSDISSAIAAAVEEQSVATGAIASSVRETNTAITEVKKGAQLVTEANSKSNQDSVEVLTETKIFREQSITLEKEVKTFLSQIRPNNE